MYAVPAMPWMRQVAKAAGDVDEIARLAAEQTTLTNALRQAFLDAVRRLADRIDTRAIADLLRQGRISEAIGVVDSALLSRGFQPVSDAVSNAIIDAGRSAAVAAALQPALSNIDISFGATNPLAVHAINAYQMDKIRELSAEALQSVRMTIASGLEQGRNPRDIAADVKAHIGLTASQTRAVLNFRRMLENRDRAALTRALRDRRFDGTVQRSILEEKPLKAEQIDRMVERYRARFLTYRAETIARTEAIRALNTGNVLVWRQAIADGKIEASAVIKRWVYTHDGRTRHAHVTIPQMNPGDIGIDESFQSELGPIRFPGDPEASAANVISCRCALVLRYRPSRSRSKAT